MGLSVLLQQTDRLSIDVQTYRLFTDWSTYTTSTYNIHNHATSYYISSPALDISAASLPRYTFHLTEPLLSEPSGQPSSFKMSQPESTQGSQAREKLKQAIERAYRGLMVVGDAHKTPVERDALYWATIEEFNGMGFPFDQFDDCMQEVAVEKKFFVLAQNITQAAEAGWHEATSGGVFQSEKWMYQLYAAQCLGLENNFALSSIQISELDRIAEENGYTFANYDAEEEEDEGEGEGETNNDNDDDEN